MNTNYSQLHHETLQNRFGLRVAARLSNGADTLPHDIGERLRVAREQAVARRKQPMAVLRRRSAGAAASKPAGAADQAIGQCCHRAAGRALPLFHCHDETRHLPRRLA